MALFICRSWGKVPPRKPTTRFKVKEVEPFVTVVHCKETLAGSTAVAVIGVAMERPDGGWDTLELSEEADMGKWRGDTPPETARRSTNRPTLEMTRRLVTALNRLREHSGRIYVYQTRP